MHGSLDLRWNMQRSEICIEDERNWDEIECQLPDRNRLRRIRQAYEEAEREDRENEYII